MSEGIMSKAATMEIPISSNGVSGTLNEDESLEQVTLVPIHISSIRVTKLSTAPILFCVLPYVVPSLLMFLLVFLICLSGLSSCLPSSFFLLSHSS